MATYKYFRIYRVEDGKTSWVGGILALDRQDALAKAATHLNLTGRLVAVER